MNTLNNPIVFLLNAVEQKGLLSVICRITGVYPLPLVAYQSVSRLLNGGNHFNFSDFLFPLGFFTLSKYYLIEKHNNTRLDKTLFLTGKNKFINFGEFLGHSLNKNTQIANNKLIN
ncbi:MAG: hypothetical protein DRI89_12025 [Bacteroidetes bacterium]|nr:MAG: hypothetical protein DRI89_12025 [Bacteroidota bacterium]